MAKKTSCPITRAQFQNHAKAIEVKIGDRTFTVNELLQTPSPDGGERGASA